MNLVAISAVMVVAAALLAYVYVVPITFVDAPALSDGMNEPAAITQNMAHMEDIADDAAPVPSQAPKVTGVTERNNTYSMMPKAGSMPESDDAPTMTSKTNAPERNETPVLKPKSSMPEDETPVQKSTTHREPIQYDHTIGGTVTKIVDGDTLDIDSTRIRLALVNTPERGEDGYKEAAGFTRQQCPVGTAAAYDPDDMQPDGSYGRVIAVVWCSGHLPDEPEASLNAMLVRSGHAEVLQRFCGTSEFGADAWAKAAGC